MKGAGLERSSTPNYFRKAVLNLNLATPPSGVSLEIRAWERASSINRESLALPEDREATPTRGIKSLGVGER